jgi:uncharacterized membrane protein YhaH (DUF805 family)/uncharacterized protein YndB with AHSA1/START domain
MESIRSLFSLQEGVGRTRYLTIGVVLALAKYAIDAAAYYIATREFWHPADYLDPSFAGRFHTGLEGTNLLPTWLLVFFVVWTLPFMWIGVAMSARRARDAGLSPWLGLLFLVPMVTYVAIALLAVVPSRPARAATRRRTDPSERSLLIFMGVVVLGCTAMIGLLTEGLAYYGVGLFLGLPFLLGAVTGFLYNLSRARKVSETVWTVSWNLMFGFFALLLFGFEGAICLIMAFPIALPAALLGALFGRALAGTPVPAGGTLGLVFVLMPLGALAEQSIGHPPLREVVTTIEIDAPPEVVWNHVVSFSELPAPDHWLFSTGVAYPLRARIEGEGVGAVRHCEFSTGAFVEPITTWDPPRRLSFDVIEQPVPMEEWSFYARVHPPHLDQSFRSRRGEFRLTETAAGGTLLEGSTWYTMDMGPAPYWQVWGDVIVHRIHRRVLEHVRSLAEADAGR